GPVRPERRRAWRRDRQPARRTAGGGRRTTRRRRGQGAAGSQQPGGPLGGQLGETLGNLLQQGLSGLGQSQGQGGTRPGGQRSIQTPASPAPAPTEAAPAEPAPPAVPSDTTAQQDSQPMNDVLRQLFNR